MVFEYILKQKGIDIEKDLTINQNIDFGSTAAAFSEGQADFTVEFEPGATTLEKAERDMLSLLSARTVDMSLTPHFLQRKAISKKIKTSFRDSRSAAKRNGLRADTYSGRKLQKIIAPQFKETDLATITTIVTRYYEQETWKENLIFEKESFETFAKYFGIC